MSLNCKELAELLYHGTFTAFSEIDLSRSAPKKDFGRGFYTTNDLEQARKFARLKAARENGSQGYVLTFSFIDKGDLNVRIFQSADEAWFDFVLRNRGFGCYAGLKDSAVPDIVIGPVADDAVGLVLNTFIDGVYGDPNSSEAKRTAIRLLLTQKLHSQIFFGTKRAVDALIFKGISDVYLDR
ncbi:MAG: DUF3990 domain-containing protein [Coriobacteriales bacterium]|jgi:hypothetical protein|nr:DUF3990 domain-containing protein [Coriobacteriales bacterium]